MPHYKLKKHHRCEICLQYEHSKTTNIRRHVRSCFGATAKKSAKQNKENSEENNEESFADENMAGCEFW